MKTIFIQNRIHEVRGAKIILDHDLAALYEVETRALNQAVRRNTARFPADSMFQLTTDEYQNLISQIVISSWGGARKLPYAFTEHGVTMLAGILKSETAINMNIAIVRAFIALREAAIAYKDLSGKLALLEKKYNKQFNDVYQALDFLLDKKASEERFHKRPRIGFKP